MTMANPHFIRYNKTVTKNNFSKYLIAVWTIVQPCFHSNPSTAAVERSRVWIFQKQKEVQELVQRLALATEQEPELSIEWPFYTCMEPQRKFEGLTQQRKYQLTPFNSMFDFECSLYTPIPCWKWKNILSAFTVASI